MEPELVALASSGAATLVGLMVSDSWVKVKEGVVRMLARGENAKQMALDLDVSRAELLTAREADDGRLMAGVEEMWRARLCRLIEAYPALAEDLRRLSEALDTTPGTGEASNVFNLISGDVRYGPVVQAGRVSGLVFNAPFPPPPAEEGEG
ncbi:hypothetical protein [Microbispora triticiradicis]|uniref:Uncharacterized protein n=2 Tax=Microbispora TaxID=2005 RepID=A0ABY3LSE6_9ACTN|nr:MULTISPECIES: hypothetical protein [Microbispora]TLP54777.1 hypothetical protein FED44_26840 [Microbispora fusca]TYB52052.1 hypothetical protein FXF59_25460 [Microbispora tritici]